MKNSLTRAEVAKALFAQNPSEKSFHMTSDDQAFKLKSDATNHAKTLEDKTVDEVFKNSRFAEVAAQTVSVDALKKVINAAGVTDEAGKILPTDETARKAAEASAAVSAQKVATKEIKEPVKPVVKTVKKEVVQTKKVAEPKKVVAESPDTKKVVAPEKVAEESAEKKEVAASDEAGGTEGQ